MRNNCIKGKIRKKKTSSFTQLLSHIGQIMDFKDFLHEYCEEKSETFTEF